MCSLQLGFLSVVDVYASPLYLNVTRSSNRGQCSTLQLVTLLHVKFSPMKAAIVGRSPLESRQGTSILSADVWKSVTPDTVNYLVSANAACTRHNVLVSP